MFQLELSNVIYGIILALVTAVWWFSRKELKRLEDAVEELREMISAERVQSNQRFSENSREMHQMTSNVNELQLNYRDRFEKVYERFDIQNRLLADMKEQILDRIEGMRDVFVTKDFCISAHQHTQKEIEDISKKVDRHHG